MATSTRFGKDLLGSIHEGSQLGRDPAFPLMPFFDESKEKMTFGKANE